MLEYRRRYCDWIAVTIQGYVTVIQPIESVLASDVPAEMVCRSKELTPYSIESVAAAVTHRITHGEESRTA